LIDSALISSRSTRSASWRRSVTVVLHRLESLSRQPFEPARRHLDVADILDGAGFADGDASGGAVAGGGAAGRGAHADAPSSSIRAFSVSAARSSSE